MAVMVHLRGDVPTTAPELFLSENVPHAVGFAEFSRISRNGAAVMSGAIYRKMNELIRTITSSELRRRISIIASFAIRLDWIYFFNVINFINN